MCTRGHCSIFRRSSDASLERASQVALETYNLKSQTFQDCMGVRKRSGNIHQHSLASTMQFCDSFLWQTCRVSLATIVLSQTGLHHFIHELL